MKYKWQPTTGKLAKAATAAISDDMREWLSEHRRRFRDHINLEFERRNRSQSSKAAYI